MLHKARGTAPGLIGTWRVLDVLFPQCSRDDTDLHAGLGVFRPKEVIRHEFGEAAVDFAQAVDSRGTAS